MSGFQIVRSQEVGASKFFDQFPAGVRYGSRKDEISQPPFGIQFMERPVAARQGLPQSAVSRGWRSAGVRPTADVEMGGQAIRQNMVLLSAFFGDEGLKGLAEQGMVSLGTRAHEIKQQVGASHLSRLP